MKTPIIPQRRLTDYRLPDGRIVPIAADCAQGAALVDFTLADGEIVYAVRADLHWHCSGCGRALPVLTAAPFWCDTCRAIGVEVA